MKETDLTQVVSWFNLVHEERLDCNLGIRVREVIRNIGNVGLELWLEMNDSGIREIGKVGEDRYAERAFGKLLNGCLVLDEPLQWILARVTTGVIKVPELEVFVERVDIKFSNSRWRNGA